MADLLDESVDFSSFGLDPRLLKAVKKLGFEHPTLVQAKAIPLALQGKDILARARTGSGKTAAYVLPLLQKLLLHKEATEGAAAGAFGVVLAPTKELCQQIKTECDNFAFYAYKLVRTCDVAAAARAPGASAAGMPADVGLADIVVGTPSTVLQAVESGAVSVAGLQMIVLDEADLLLSYGYEADMKNLVAKLPRICQGMLVSATMTEDVEALKKLVLHTPAILKLQEEVSAASSIAQRYVYTDGDLDKFLILYALIKLQIIQGKTLVFVRDIARCFRLKLYLDKFSINAAVLNADLPLNSRIHTVAQFNKGVFPILIAVDDHEEEEEEESEVESDDEPSSKRKRVSFRKDEDMIKSEPEDSDEEEEEDDQEGDEDEDDDKEEDEEGNDGDSDADDCKVKKEKESEDEQESEKEDENGDDDKEEEKSDDDDDENGSDVEVKQEVESDEEDEEDEEDTPESGKKRRREVQKKDKEYGVSRGVDFRGVAVVINLDLPATPTSYVHKIGRTGRGYRAPGSKVTHSGLAISFVDQNEDSEQFERICADQKEAGHELVPFELKKAVKDALVYRCEDVFRSITRRQIQEARANALRAEVANSARLKEHFAENPRELSLLRGELHHDRKLVQGSVQEELKMLPAYILPADVKVKDQGGVKVNKWNPRNFRSFRRVKGKNKKGKKKTRASAGGGNRNLLPSTLGGFKKPAHKNH